MNSTDQVVGWSLSCPVLSGRSRLSTDVHALYARSRWLALPGIVGGPGHLSAWRGRSHRDRQAGLDAELDVCHSRDRDDPRSAGEGSSAETGTELVTVSNSVV